MSYVVAPYRMIIRMRIMADTRDSGRGSQGAPERRYGLFMLVVSTQELSMPPKQRWFIIPMPSQRNIPK